MASRETIERWILPFDFGGPEMRRDRAGEWVKYDDHRRALEAALAARPAPEAGSMAVEDDGAAFDPYDLIRSQTAQIASLSAKVAEVELANADLELIADENADNVRLIDKIAKLIGIPHDQELTIQDVHVWKHAVQARASELQLEVERLERENDVYVVWSHEHSAWWRANSRGYARRIEDAGVYSRAEAISISHRGRDGWGPGEISDELPIRVADLPDFARAALQQEGESDV